MTIYEYVLETKPQTLAQLWRVGLLRQIPNDNGDIEKLTRKDVIALMRHDYWKRVRGSLKQVYSRWQFRYAFCYLCVIERSEGHGH